MATLTTWMLFIVTIVEAVMIYRQRKHIMRDPLTGLLSKAAIYMHGEKTIAHSARTGQPVAVLFMDMDNFKMVNDRFGHKVGDEILCKLAATTQVRDDEPFGRIQGDEFVVILWGGMRAANAFALRLMTALERTNKYAQKRKISRVGLSVGCAILEKGEVGVVCWWDGCRFVPISHDATKDRTFLAVLELADKGMRTAKEQKRLKR